MTKGNPTSRPARVLIVDDEPHMARFLEFVLAEAGYQVTIAADGVEALAAAERFAPDAVLLDPVLPRMSGWEVIKQLRSQAKEARLIILVVGHGSLRDTHERILKAGADAYCTKPIKPSTLLNELNDLGLPPILG